MKNKKIGLLAFNGGLASTTLLLDMVNQGMKVLPYSFTHKEYYSNEINCGVKIIEELFDAGKNNLVKGVKVVCIADLYKPHFGIEKEELNNIVVPNLNDVILLALEMQASFINNPVETGVGCHGSSRYVLPYKIRSAPPYKYYTPFTECSKKEVIKKGIKLCDDLKLDFNKIYKHTVTSKKAKVIDYSIIQQYKDESVMHRLKAFYDLGIEDPAIYCDEDWKIVDWETCVNQVKKVFRK